MRAVQPGCANEAVTKEDTRQFGGRGTGTRGTSGQGAPRQGVRAAFATVPASADVQNARRKKRLAKGRENGSKVVRLAGNRRISAGSCGREAEGGGLLNRYTVEKPYRGFESLRLRQYSNFGGQCVGIPRRSIVLAAFLA